MNNKQNGVSRLLRLVWKEYKIEMLVVILAIIGSALASVKGTLFLQTLIDDYIVPLTESNYPDFAPLASALFKIAMIYILGILCSYIYNRIMVNVSQGTMKIIRIKLFNHMQSLPIQYFDSHSHGDIMSIYTNDTDTLRQFLSQSVPQLFNSIITIVSIFVAMITLNIPLTIITLVMVAIMLVVAKNAAALSSKYFNQQQNNLGKLNGFIEEMISGQKVVKVFCYEKRSLARFRSVNEELKESSQKANIYGNILMPIIIQIGNVSYVICAVIGSILILNGYGGLSVGMLVSFLTLNKNFNQPFGQVSQQLNSIIISSMAVSIGMRNNLLPIGFAVHNEDRDRTYSESWTYHIIAERLIAYKYGRISEVQVQNIEKNLSTIIQQFEEMKKDLVFLLSENGDQQN